jgi:HSP20 family molecular chaperone IbpA
MATRHDADQRMWAQACELIAEAERLHRQFFRLAVDSAPATWEPPIDVFEDEREIVVVVAMPGVAAERVQVVHRGRRAGRARHAAAALRGARGRLRQLEIPYGAFERRIALPPGNFEVGRPELCRVAWCCDCANRPHLLAHEQFWRALARALHPAPARRPSRCGNERGRRGRRRRHDRHAPAARRCADRPAGAQSRRIPATVLPIGLGRERSQAAVQEAVRLEKPIGVLLQSKPDVDEPGPTTCTGSARAPRCCATSPRPTAAITSSRAG